MGQFRNAQGQEAGTICHADLFNVPGTRDRFTLNVNCPHCGRIGQITWEENAIGYREAGPQRRLIAVSTGFHSEEGRTLSRDPLIVCDDCDSILPD